MPMIYLQALATFRQAVNQKHQLGANRSMRRVNETSRGRGGRGSYRGGRCGGRGGRGGRGGNNSRKNVKRPQSYPVTLNNGTIVDIHSSHYRTRNLVANKFDQQILFDSRTQSI